MITFCSAVSPLPSCSTHCTASCQTFITGSTSMESWTAVVSWFIDPWILWMRSSGEIFVLFLAEQPGAWTNAGDLEAWEAEILGLGFNSRATDDDDFALLFWEGSEEDSSRWDRNRRGWHVYGQWGKISRLYRYCITFRVNVEKWAHNFVRLYQTPDQ